MYVFPDTCKIVLQNNNDILIDSCECCMRYVRSLIIKCKCLDLYYKYLFTNQSDMHAENSFIAPADSIIYA